MMQAAQIMLIAVAITIVVGFSVSLMIQILTKAVNLGDKGRNADPVEESERALALALALTRRKSEKE